MKERSVTVPVAAGEPSPKSNEYVVGDAAVWLGRVVTPHTTCDVPRSMSRLGIISVSAETTDAIAPSRSTTRIAICGARACRPAVMNPFFRVRAE
jgi:hypothetical protein